MDPNRIYVFALHLPFRSQARILCPLLEQRAQLVRCETISNVINSFEFSRKKALHSPGSINITTELRRFNEFTALNRRFHVITFHEMIMDSIFFTWPWLSCRMWNTKRIKRVKGSVIYTSCIKKTNTWVQMFLDILQKVFSTMFLFPSQMDRISRADVDPFLPSLNRLWIEWK